MESMTMEQYRAMVHGKAAKKPHKYGAQSVVVDGIRFDSKREANRWRDLLLMLRAGEITHLERAVAYVCVVNGVRVCRYIADFRYERDGAQVVEDAKGVRTAVYRLKKKLVKACHGVEIVEV